MGTGEGGQRKSGMGLNCPETLVNGADGFSAAAMQLHPVAAF